MFKLSVSFIALVIQQKVGALGHGWVLLVCLHQQDA